MARSDVTPAACSSRTISAKSAARFLSRAARTTRETLAAFCALFAAISALCRCTSPFRLVISSSLGHPSKFPEGNLDHEFHKKRPPHRDGLCLVRLGAALPPDRQVDAPGQQVKRDVCGGEFRGEGHSRVHGVAPTNIASIAVRASRRFSSSNDA